MSTLKQIGNFADLKQFGCIQKKTRGTLRSNKISWPNFVRKTKPLGAERVCEGCLYNELCTVDCTHTVISDKVHRLLVTLSYFRPDRFVQLLSLITLISPSLNRSSVYWFMRVSFQKENNFILNLIQIALVLKLPLVSTLTNKCKC